MTLRSRLALAAAMGMLLPDFMKSETPAERELRTREADRTAPSKERLTKAEKKRARKAAQRIRCAQANPK